jgi:mannose-6-phosphate isomerase-like protein (cupin superfamily)
MRNPIEQVVQEGEMLAIIVRDEYSQPGISFFTPKDFSQQLAYMQHLAGTVIQPHFHNPVPRTIHYTQEALFIRRGRLRVDFFDEEQNYLESRELKAGDVILLVRGGHGFEALEQLEMIEVKQGPYVGDKCKTRFVGKIPAGQQS